MHYNVIKYKYVFNKIRKTLVNKRFAINENIYLETRFDSNALNIKMFQRKIDSCGWHAIILLQKINRKIL